MTILRWIGVLPIAVLSTFIINIIWSLLLLISPALYIEDNFLWKLVFVDILSAVLSGASFVYFGVYIAPNFKKETALILTIIFGIMSGISFFAANFLTSEYFSNISIISGIVGAISCYFELLKTEKEKEKEENYNLE
ncbi:hypothetical protein [Tenacibaculum dicentrarchi]|uniref:hypothetical protein n=1 Tax=Tenacibaculum dicentrarchi TaxID=669041 RepID=UPI000C7A0A68|nr:membrane hypothetical protein [Tenacibaculum dicentrarchi]